MRDERASPETDESNLAITQPSPMDDQHADTRLATRISSSGGRPTEYTRYNSIRSNSTGFEQAQEIAQKTLNTGLLLKKRFVLEDALGQGGMGTVYKAKDLRKVEAEDPNPYIAIKVLNQDFRDHPDAFVTLQQEAAKSHTLAHPNIVTVHDFDRDGDTLFMTMELLEGKPLDDLLKTKGKHGLPKARGEKILRDLCAALAYAHQRHIIHADFKPGNVFVMADGSAKVLDFGIARAASKESQKHTFDAAQLGALTPAYATIEMIDDEPLTFSDDVYAFACVAYEIFSGRHPYAGRSAYTAKTQGLKPQRLDNLTNRQWRALQRALALEKAQRTPTIQQFFQEFFPRNNSLALTTALLVALVAMGGAGWFAFEHYQAAAQVETTIAEKLLQSQECLANNDFRCSIDNARVVINLAPDHRAANAILHTAEMAQQKQLTQEHLTRLTREAEQCLAQQDHACVHLKARELLSLDSNHSPAQVLLTQAKQLAQRMEIGALAQDAETCLAQQDLPCAERLAEKAMTINQQDPEALALYRKVQDIQQTHTLASAALAQQLAELVSAGEKCLGQKNYTCAQRQADAALARDGGFAPAINLRQSATLASQQAREAEAKVKNILAEANTCLEQQKNYSCAIAKAEAALAIIPEHHQARAIKQRAEQTQRQLKETGFTIR